MRRNSVERHFSQRWLWVWGLLAVALLACGVPVNELNELLTTPTAVSQPLPATTAPLPHSQPTPPPTAVVPQPPLSLALAPTTPILGPGASYTQQWTGAVNASQTPPLSLRLPEGRQLLLLVNPTAGLDVTFTLLDETGETIQRVNERGAGAAELLPFTATGEQAYSLQVSAVGSGADVAPAYTVAVIDLDAPGGEAVRLDTTAVLASTDVGRHSFPATVGETFFILLEPDSTLNPLLELYSPTGFIFSENRGGPGEPESRVFAATTTTTYQLVIFPFGGSSGSYRLRAISLAQ